MSEGKKIWKNEEALRLAMLQELANMRANNEGPGGASGKQLRDCLHLKSVVELESPLLYLYEKGYVDAFEYVFIITEKGLRFLADLDDEWTFHSLVPRRPLPNAGAGAVALALPEPPSDVDDEVA